MAATKSPLTTRPVSSFVQDTLSLLRTMVKKQAALRAAPVNKQLMADAERHQLTSSPFRDWMAVVERLTTDMFREMGFTTVEEQTLAMELLQEAATTFRFDPIVQEHAFWVKHNRTLDYSSPSPSSPTPLSVPLIPLANLSSGATLRWAEQQQEDPNQRWLVVAGSKT